MHLYSCIRVNISILPAVVLLLTHNIVYRFPNYCSCSVVDLNLNEKNVMQCSWSFSVPVA